MSTTEILELPSQIESHELRTWPASVSPTAATQSASTSSLPVQVNREVHSEIELEISQLAPIDGGIAAWRLLGAAFVFETLLWGALLLLT